MNSRKLLSSVFLFLPSLSSFLASFSSAFFLLQFQLFLLSSLNFFLFQFSFLCFCHFYFLALNLLPLVAPIPAVPCLTSCSCQCKFSKSMSKHISCYFNRLEIFSTCEYCIFIPTIFGTITKSLLCVLTCLSLAIFLLALAINFSISLNCLKAALLCLDFRYFANSLTSKDFQFIECFSSICEFFFLYFILFSIFLFLPSCSS